MRRTTHKSATCLRGLLVLLLALSSLGLETAYSQTPAPQGTLSATDSTAPQRLPQEQFLQQFISRSLVEPAAEGKGASAIPARDAALPTTSALLQDSTVPQASSQLATTATTMLLALGGILACLVGGAYLVRRYFLTQQPFGKRSQPLRVLARTYITPKVAVALLEVPGKLLVIGVTGSTLVSLGEVAIEAAERPQPETVAQPLEFAAALEQSVQALTPPPVAEPQPRAFTVPFDPEPEEEPEPGQGQGDHAFLRLAEQIQSRLSTLKQL